MIFGKHASNFKVHSVKMWTTLSASCKRIYSTLLLIGTKDIVRFILTGNLKKRKVLFFFCLLMCVQSLRAELHMQLRVGEMCNEAQVVLEGEYLGGDRVNVVRVYKTNVILSDVVIVPGLQKEEKPLSTKRLFLFLGFGEECSFQPSQESCFNDVVKNITSGTLTPLRQIDKGGSDGVIWFDDTCCYRYRQAMNPGPLALFPDFKNYETGEKNSAADVRTEIETGLKESLVWNRASSLTSAYDRTRLMCRFLLQSTSPTPENLRYYQWFAVWHTDWDATGEFAGPYLAELLINADPKESVHEIVRVLGFIGAPHSASAVHSLGALLSGDPERAHPEWVIEAIADAQDPAGITYLLPQLDSDKSYIAAEAGIALCRLKAVEHFDRICKVLSVNSKTWFDGKYLEQLEALYQLDPVRARPVIEEKAKRFDKEYPQGKRISDILL